MMTLEHIVLWSMLCGGMVELGQSQQQQQQQQQQQNQELPPDNCSGKPGSKCVCIVEDNNVVSNALTNADDMHWLDTRKCTHFLGGSIAYDPCNNDSSSPRGPGQILCTSPIYSYPGKLTCALDDNGDYSFAGEVNFGYADGTTFNVSDASNIPMCKIMIVDTSDGTSRPVFYVWVLVASVYLILSSSSFL
jgi:hypothetical protein